jgi:hypothetical protein
MLGLVTPRMAFTRSATSWYGRPSFHMRYPIVSAAERDTPCEQCTSTQPPDDRAACVHKKHCPSIFFFDSIWWWVGYSMAATAGCQCGSQHITAATAIWLAYAVQHLNVLEDLEHDAGDVLLVVVCSGADTRLVSVLARDRMCKHLSSDSFGC